MTRIRLFNDSDFVSLNDEWGPTRRRGLATSVPAGTTFITSNFPAFAAAEVIDSGNNATAAANGDTAGGSFIISTTGTAAADANTIVTATAATRRDWNPWIRFRIVTGTNTQMASTRLWIGAFSSDPSALDTLATLSAACFGWDTVIDSGTVAAGTGYWRCETGNTATAQKTTANESSGLFPMLVRGARVYTAEIRMDTANARIDFYMADHGISSSPKVFARLKKIASHATSVPVAITPLLLGGTVTVLATAAAAKKLGIGSCGLIQD